MATTEEINEAVARTQEWAPYFEAAPPPDTLVEHSVPIVDRAVGLDDWESIHTAIGNGIIDDDGGPYFVTAVDNATRSITVRPSLVSGKARAFFAGHYHVLPQPKTLVFDMPSAGQIVYNIGLVKTAQPTAQGHVVLQGWADGQLPTGSRGFPFYTFPWQANQLLTDAWANRTNKRVMISPTMTVGAETARPDWDQVIWGTQVLVLETGIIYRADYDGWIPVNAQDWSPQWLSSGIEYRGYGTRPEWVQIPGGYKMRGTYMRSNGSQFAAGREVILGGIPNLPRPLQSTYRFMAYAGGGAAVEIIVETNGTIKITPFRDTWTIGVDGLEVHTK